MWFFNKSKEIIDVQVKVLAETPKAYLIEVNGRKV